MKMIIKINHLEVSFGNFYALKDINLDLTAGRITGFIGPSGAGKTTLIRAIVGRQKVHAGTITVFGQAAGSASLRSKISYMTQELSIYPDLNVTQNLRYFATMRGVPKQDLPELTRKLLQTVDMTPQNKQLGAKLSGGQKQRLSLAIALIGQPALMVLDEPTVGLDPMLRDQIWQLFGELTKQGISLIITSHVMDEAARCEDLVLIRNGTILAHDTPQALCRRTNSRNVEQSFLKLVKGEQ